MKKTIIFLFIIELLLLLVCFWDPYIVKKKTQYEPLEIDFFIDTSFSQKKTADKIKKQLTELKSDSIDARYFAFNGRVRPLDLTTLKPDDYSSIYSLAAPLNRQLKETRAFAVVVSDFNFFDQQILSNEKVFLLRNKKNLLPHGLAFDMKDASLLFKKDEPYKITVAAYSILRKKVKIQLSISERNGEFSNYTKELSIPQKGTNVDFYLSVNPNQEQYVIAKMLLDNNELARDVFLISPIKKDINILLLSFHPSFVVKTVKLFFEKYSGYKYVSKEFYSPQLNKNSLEFKKTLVNVPHQLLILIDPPVNIQKMAIKNEAPFLWISTLSSDESPAFASDDLDFFYPFVNFKGNEQLSRRFWKSMKLKTNPLTFPPDAKIFHEWQKKSAWFETKKYHYLGLTPLVQDRVDVIKFYQILYPLFQSLHTRSDLRLPISSGVPNNLVSLPITALEGIELFKHKKTLVDRLTFSSLNSKILSYRPGEKIFSDLEHSQFFKLKKKNGEEQLITLRLPARELFDHHFTDTISSFEDDFSSLKKILQNKLSELPPETISKKIPLVPHSLLFLLIILNFFIIMLLKKRLNK